VGHGGGEGRRQVGRDGWAGGGGPGDSVAPPVAVAPEGFPGPISVWGGASGSWLDRAAAFVVADWDEAGGARDGAAGDGWSGRGGRGAALGRGRRRLSKEDVLAFLKAGTERWGVGLRGLNFKALGVPESRY
jgi:hypothetical protein